MASESERKRGREEDEAAAVDSGRRMKRARQDDEEGSSEGELSIHASTDEDLFSLRTIVTKGTKKFQHMQGSCCPL